MGCAACVTEAKVVEPQKPLWQVLGQALASQLSKLQPSSLVPKPLFDDQISLLHRNIVMKQGKPTKQQVDNQEVVDPNELLRVKWKLLILCSGLDLYNKEYSELDESLHHDCFSQIQKDLTRTFPDQQLFLTEASQATFKRLLKRLTLYFPDVGYTQGLNFIVGYLLIRGYGEADTFWLVTHLAIHPNYLLLGLFEDGFPLSLIYCRLFKQLFKVKLPKLSSRFDEIGVADQIWIFKWFMTYFIYSFPFDIVKEIWDTIIVLGGLGSIYFAVALVAHLEKYLMELEDDVAVATFFSSLKQKTYFNQIVDLQKVIKSAYEMKIQKHIIAQESKNVLSLTGQNFYVRYFTVFDDELQKEILITNWQKNIKFSREKFEEESRAKLRMSYEAKHMRLSQQAKRKDSKLMIRSQVQPQETRSRMNTSTYLVRLDDKMAHPNIYTKSIQEEKDEQVVIFELDKLQKPSFKKKNEIFQAQSTKGVVNTNSRVATEKGEAQKKIKKVREEFSQRDNSSSNKGSISRLSCQPDNAVCESIYEYSVDSPEKIQVENVQ